jgi:diamine N-acetyltransferase
MQNYVSLSNTIIKLRALEPEDIYLLLLWENDERIWNVSDTLQPFSKSVLTKYIENSAADIFESKQLRLMIDSISDKKTVGMIDLFDFDPRHRRAGVGIMIHESEQQKKYAQNALKVLIRYAFDHLHLHQLFCNIGIDNPASLKLFQNAGFQITGTKKDWIKTKTSFQDEYFLQLLENKI